MKVLKFGGSSVKDAVCISKVINIIKDKYKSTDQLVVVCSALGGMTDLLLEMSSMAAAGNEGYLQLFNTFRKTHISVAKALLTAKKYKEVKKDLKQNHETLSDLLKGVYLIRESSDRTQAHILSFGERNSNYIISNTLTDKKIKTTYIDAKSLIVTDSNFLNAVIKQTKTSEKIKTFFKTNRTKCTIVTGFVSANENGLRTVLGRGGSDYTASILAANLGAEVLEIWTDVDGVLSADPRKVKNAFSLKSMSYLEAMEISHFGAKVIYPPTIKPAMDKKIPIYIKNTFNPTHPGTRIHTISENKNIISGISAISNISLMTLEGSGMQGVPGVAARLFSVLSQTDINIVLITQASSEHAITFAITSDNTKKAQKVINNAFSIEIARKIVFPIKIENNMSILAIVGEQMYKQIGVAGKLFNVLDQHRLNVFAIAQGSSKLNISFALKSSKLDKALNVIHEEFFKKEIKHDPNIINVYMIGVGLIGTELLRQLNKHKNSLAKKYGKDIRIVGLANSKKMLFDTITGIDIRTSVKQLEQTKEKMNLQLFIDKIKSYGLPNSVFIDNTASEDVANIYQTIFKTKTSVITANKIANTGTLSSYNRLKATCKENNQHLYFETNVGAGLPIISTIDNLIDTGDTILKVEAVLSGSLSYIFNNFNSKTSFYDIIKKAEQLGYTEPDPRLDLSGKDVKRKILIIARIMGLQMNPSAVKVQNILPKSCIAAKSIEKFYTAVKAEQDYFSNLISKAEKNDSKLRFLCGLENGKAYVKLEEVGKNNPFYTLDGSDNMIVIKTKRYYKNPLIIRGPGAGAEVTAAGVFADLVNYIKLKS